MQSCNRCKRKFTFKQVLRSCFHGYKPIQCDRCDQIYDVTLGSRLRVSVTIAAAMFPAFYVYKGPIYGHVLIYLLILILVLPFLMRYKQRIEDGDI
ncbi:hypothetical protein IM700_010180 [Paenibacillus sp. DXFW5]|uniref:CXXC-20-CXXC protein n=1 Tax=Paenibacillus rhizolycopersici TaxID=2780073 RepID=A0ABS2H3H8_9BACL|nr:hypothetical protein [Paenibacillus rhizolycopersici]